MRNVRCTKKALENIASYSISTDPNFLSRKQAMAADDSDEFRKAEEIEKQGHMKAATWKLVKRSSLPEHAKLFYPRAIYQRKRKPPTADNPEGAIDKHKCRVTVAAHTRMLVEGIDYDEKYASTVRWNSIRLLIAIANEQDYEIVQCYSMQ